MKPQDYLTDRGKEIFQEIVAAIPNQDILLKTDSLELSMLAQAFDVYARGAKELNDGDSIKTTKAQLSTIIKQSSDFITKNSDKFGLNPAAREKIQAFAMKKEEKESILKSMSNTSATWKEKAG